MTIVGRRPLVNITLRKIALSEELVYYIRKVCAAMADAQEEDDQWTILVEGGHPDRVRVDAYLITRSGHTRLFASQSDADVFLAVRNAFSMLRPVRYEEALDICELAVSDPRTGTY